MNASETITVEKTGITVSPFLELCSPPFLLSVPRQPSAVCY